MPGVIGAVGVIRFGWLGNEAARIDPDDPAQVALGRRIDAERRASCHGAHLEGQPNWRERRPDGRLPAPPHDASGHTWHHPDDVLFDITKEGVTAHAPPGYRTDMPAFGDALIVTRCPEASFTGAKRSLQRSRVVQ